MTKRKHSGKQRNAITPWEYVYEISVIHAASVVGGDVAVLELLVNWFVHNAVQARIGQGPMCLCCEHKWSMRDVASTPRYFMLALPVKAPSCKPAEAIVAAVCVDCYDLPDLQTRVMAQFDKIMPGFVVQARVSTVVQ